MTPIVPLIRRPVGRPPKPKSTVAFNLTPSSLVSAAGTDIARKRHNRGVRPGHYKEFAFDPRDVTVSSTPEIVLERALRRAIAGKERYGGRIRKLLYKNRRLLRQALKLARAR